MLMGKLDSLQTEYESNSARRREQDGLVAQYELEIQKLNEKVRQLNLEEASQSKRLEETERLLKAKSEDYEQIVRNLNKHMEHLSGEDSQKRIFMLEKELTELKEKKTYYKQRSDQLNRLSSKIVEKCKEKTVVPNEDVEAPSEAEFEYEESIQ